MANEARGVGGLGVIKSSGHIGDLDNRRTVQLGSLGTLPLGSACGVQS